MMEHGSFLSMIILKVFEEVAMIVALQQTIKIHKSLLEISHLHFGFVATTKDKNDKGGNKHSG